MKYCIVKLLLLLGCTIFMVGCLLPSRYSIIVPSPDGRVTIDFESITKYDLWRFGPEPPRVRYCKGLIKGKGGKNQLFKLVLRGNFAPNSLAQGVCDIQWSYDSEMFAVKTAYELLVYDKMGMELYKYHIKNNERISTIQWKEDEPVLLFVVKSSEKDLPLGITYFYPIDLKLFAANVREGGTDLVFNEGLSKDWKYNSYIGNSILWREKGEEFSEISTDSSMFVYCNNRKTKVFYIQDNRVAVLHDSLGKLSGIWWLNDTQVLLYYYFLKADRDIYLMCQTSSGECVDISNVVEKLPLEKRHSMHWYKDLLTSSKPTRHDY